MLSQNKHLGSTLKQGQSRQHMAITLTNTDFVNDIVLHSDINADVQHRVELTVKEIGLALNGQKTE